MKRILILGNGGSGKTFLAKRLSHILNHKVVHLDTLYWKDQWQHTDPTQWQSALHQAINEECWIIEGTPIKDLEIRIAAADSIIFLDTNKYICIWRLLIRGLQAKWGRNQIPKDGSPVRGISWKAIYWVWRFPWRTKPSIMDQLKNCNKKIICFRHKNKIQEFLAALQTMPRA